MGQKKKRGHPDVEELLGRPWCYYCERDFDDLKILISHQKAKHFKCDRCGRRLNTAGGLSVHMNQVHKESLQQVENALPNRQGLEVEIFGMEGIPEDISQAHNQRIIAQFYQAEADHRTSTGNNGLNSSTGGMVKKPKFESPADLKKRLAEHKARKTEQAANGTGSGGNTPMEGMANSPMQSPAAFSGSPYAPAPTPYSTGPPTSGYGSFSQEPYQSAASYSQNFPPQPTLAGPPGSQYQPQFSPSQHYPAQPSMPQSYPAPPPSFQNPHYPAGSSTGSFNNFPGLASHTPPSHAGLPNRPPSLPPAPGLPQRPSFATPPVPSYQGQQLHQSSANGWNGQDQNSAMSSAYPPPSHGYNGTYSTNASVDHAASGVGDEIDKLIRMAEAGIKPPKKEEAMVPPAALPQAPETIQSMSTPAEPTQHTPQVAKPAEKKSKKDTGRMVYSNPDVSPEEMMAMMPRYAFVPDGKTEQGSIEAISV